MIKRSNSGSSIPPRPVIVVRQDNNNNDGDDDDDDSNQFSAVLQRTPPPKSRTMEVLKRWKRLHRRLGGGRILLGLLILLVLGYFLFTLRHVTYSLLIKVQYGFYMTAAVAGEASAAVKKKEEEEYNFQLDSNWTMIGPDATKNPFSVFTPKLNVIWSRGWYNAFTSSSSTTTRRPSSIPLEYFNKQHNAVLKVNKDQTLQHKLWNPASLCSSSNDNKHNVVWIRSADMSTFVKYVQRHEQDFMANNNCSFSIVNSDGDDDVSNEFHFENSPIGTKGRIPDVFDYLLYRAPFIHTWYAQNLMVNTTTITNKKLVPIPIGLELHKSISWSTTRTPFDVLRVMKQIRKKTMKHNHKRQANILVDIGSVTWCQRRIRTRTALQHEVTQKQCSGAGAGGTTEMTVMTRRSRVQAWETYAAHDFAVAPPGCGWDTHRVWELLFLGTIPIVLHSTVTEQLLVQAHVPVLVVDSWKDLCHLQTNTTLYQTVLERYRDWVQKYAHYWLQPNLWIPRDQHRMDIICQHIYGCVEAKHLRHRMESIPAPPDTTTTTIRDTTDAGV